MTIGAIITGDIVDSTKLTSEERDCLIQNLKSIPSLVSSLVELEMEIFRGDGFQISVPCVGMSLRIALIIRAFLRSRKDVRRNQQLDARLALGIGSIDYKSDTLATSDGEAFRLSGRLLDEMRSSRLEIITPWTQFNDEFSLVTAFADDVVTSWTKSQSKIILSSLVSEKGHQEIAEEIGVSRQNIDKSLRASKEDLILRYIKRFEKVISIKTGEIC